MYKGDTNKRAKQKLSKFDIVITSYGIVRSELKSLNAQKNKKGRKKNKTNLFKYTWFRIVCDEATAIHNFKTGNSKAVLQLKGICKWLLTGTPIQNTMNDLQAFAIYLKYQPWNNLTIWKDFISSKIKLKKMKLESEKSDEVIQGEPQTLSK